jgi:transcriptional regulator
MKRRVWKEDVIRTTWQLITRHGIRAVRVDEIAQCLGMSKRTLYELFPDKTNLIAACLEQTSSQQKEKIAQLREEYSGDPLQKLFRIIGKYLGDIYLVDCEFLSDMKEKSDFTEAYNNDGRFWREEIGSAVQSAIDSGNLLADVNPTALTDRLLSSLFESRLRGVSRREQQQFCRAILRGCATRQGIERIDRLHESDPDIV